MKNIDYKKLSSSAITILEYVTAVYAFIALLTNMGNISGLFSFDTFYMKDTFFGLSLIVVFLIEYGFDNFGGNKVFCKLRPVIMGMTAAAVIVVCDIKLCLLLAAVAGFLVLKGDANLSLKNALYIAFNCTMGLEIYSIFFIMLGFPVENSVSSVLRSYFLDVLFLLLCIAICALDIKKKEKAAPSIRSRRRKLGFRKHLLTAARFAGGAVFVCAVGLFIYYFALTQSDFDQIGQAVSNEYVSTVKAALEESFRPTSFYELMFLVYGGLTAGFFIVIAFLLMGSLYVAIQKNCMITLIYDVVFIYALVYGAVSAMLLVVFAMFTTWWMSENGKPGTFVLEDQKNAAERILE